MSMKTRYGTEGVKRTSDSLTVLNTLIPSLLGHIFTLGFVYG
ncbi:hypothetical protein E2C01_022504 [Portunus trituberculatus]|uniref:Uncharacterized protein n=1 Tax=Portunus trituberculatus TaxID=210409 RepID=A0A5B7E5I5_PORTR|nr:hypothetical protein [Portunus trituberculatus]